MTIRKTWKPPLTAKSTCQSKCGPIVASTSAVQLMTLCGGCCKLHWKSFCVCRTHRAAQKSTLARTLAGQSEPQTTACSWCVPVARYSKCAELFCVVKSHSKKRGKKWKFENKDRRTKNKNRHHTFCTQFYWSTKSSPASEKRSRLIGKPRSIENAGVAWKLDSVKCGFMGSITQAYVC